MINLNKEQKSFLITLSKTIKSSQEYLIKENFIVKILDEFTIRIMFTPDKGIVVYSDFGCFHDEKVDSYHVLSILAVKSKGALQFEMLPSHTIAYNGNGATIRYDVIPFDLYPVLWTIPLENLTKTEIKLSSSAMNIVTALKDNAKSFYQYVFCEKGQVVVSSTVCAKTNGEIGKGIIAIDKDCVSMAYKLSSWNKKITVYHDETNVVLKVSDLSNFTTYIQVPNVKFDNKVISIIDRMSKIETVDFWIDNAIENFISIDKEAVYWFKPNENSFAEHFLLNQYTLKEISHLKNSQINVESNVGFLMSTKVMKTLISNNFTRIKYNPVSKNNDGLSESFIIADNVSEQVLVAPVSRNNKK